MTSLVPDSGWLKALELPTKIFVGLFLFFSLLLSFNALTIVNLADFGSLARTIAIVGLLLFGCLSAAGIGAFVVDMLMQKRKRTLLALGRELRDKEKKRKQGEFEALALGRLDYLSREEIRYVAEQLRKNEQSFTTYVHSPPISNLMAAGLVSTPGGQHNEDYYPFFFRSFAWQALLARKDEFIKKNDEHKRKETEENQRKRLR